MKSRKIYAILILLVMTIPMVSHASDGRSDVIRKPLTFSLDTLASGLVNPWSVAFLPSGELLVTERTVGQLRLVKDGKVDPTPIAGLPEIFTKGQGGLLEVVTHPKYAENGWLYISFSSPKKEGEAGEGANTELIRARLKDHSLVDVQSIYKAMPNVKSNPHFGGRIVFDNKGYVFLSIGERGQKEKSQDLSTDQGRVVRLHEDGQVPKDNPFVGKAGAREGIFSYGHRNPQGLAFQPGTGRLWEHEHGPQGGDELNIIEKGKNYGWPAITYGIDYDNSIISKDSVMAGMEQPVIFWRPSIAPCGMAFISSDKYPGMKGDLLVSSMKFKYIKLLKIKGKKVVSQETILDKIGRVRDIKQGPDGYIYVVIEERDTVNNRDNGRVVRVIPEK